MSKVPRRGGVNRVHIVFFSARELTKQYRTGEIVVDALRSVDLDLVEGEFIVILGPSGSGKSTLLNIMGGLDVPTSGTVWFRDQNMTTADDAALTKFRRDFVGFIFQFYNLIPSLTARENVQLITEIAADPLEAAEALGMVGLSDRLDHFPSQLSGGEQQRIAIARAIAKRPQILLCDEPTGALDYETGKAVLEALEHVNKTFGTTTVVITHNVAIAGIADRVVSMRSGEIVDVRSNAAKLKPEDLQW